MPDHANLKRMREIMRKLDEVSRTAQELRARVQHEMESAHRRDAPAADDPEVTEARKASRRRNGRRDAASPSGKHR